MNGGILEKEGGLQHRILLPRLQLGKGGAQSLVLALGGAQVLQEPLLLGFLPSQSAPEFIHLPA
jgi:hypothetical protein